MKKMSTSINGCEEYDVFIHKNLKTPSDDGKSLQPPHGNLIFRQNRCQQFLSRSDQILTCYVVILNIGIQKNCRIVVDGGVSGET